MIDIRREVKRNNHSSGVAEKHGDCNAICFLHIRKSSFYSNEGVVQEPRYYVGMCSKPPAAISMTVRSLGRTHNRERRPAAALPTSWV